MQIAGCHARTLPPFPLTRYLGLWPLLASDKLCGQRFGQPRNETLRNFADNIINAECQAPLWIVRAKFRQIADPPAMISNSIGILIGVRQCSSSDTLRCRDSLLD